MARRRSSKRLRSEAARTMQAAADPEARKRGARRMWDRLTPEERAERVRRASAARWGKR